MKKPWPEIKPSVYASLKEACKASGHSATIITIEVGSMGFLHTAGFKQLCNLVKASAADKIAMETEVVKRGVVRSYRTSASGIGGKAKIQALVLPN